MSFGQRSCGLLLHLTSLESDFGCGDLGAGARSFVDFLQAAGQTWWQLLPIHPVGPGESPYMSPSAFAGHALFISPAELVHAGWLRADELDAHLDRSPAEARSQADFARARFARGALLPRAFERFERDPSAREELTRYATEQAHWLDDYALFRALQRHYPRRLWMKWPAELARREPDALAAARAELQPEVRFHQFTQFVFERQWNELRHYAAERQVRLIGDVPHFVDGGGVDVWTYPTLFQLDDRGRPRRVSGTRPDVFQPDGQRWGHPLYNWDAHRAEDFAWWQRRCARTLALHDALRLDHFPGFVRTWSLPGVDASDAEGRFEAGPGAELFEALRSVAPSECLVAEDLGDVDDQTEALLDKLGIRGMTLLCHSLANVDELAAVEGAVRERSIVYTSNHDTDTAQGEFDALSDAARADAARVLAAGADDLPSAAQALIELAIRSPADTAILAAQDVLGRSSEARMNRPGTASGNWAWRATPGSFTSDRAATLRELCEHSARA